VEAADKATAALLGDLRFEHLDHADDQVWRFVAESGAHRSADHVPTIVTRCTAEVTQAAC